MAEYIERESAIRAGGKGVSELPIADVVLRSDYENLRSEYEKMCTAYRKADNDLCKANEEKKILLDAVSNLSRALTRHG